MDAPTTLQLLQDRLDMLLLRHDELLRTHRLLTEQLQQSRDAQHTLQQRLQTAQSRLDLILQRLPQPTESPE